jgi:hypothetical protein
MQEQMIVVFSSAAETSVIDVVRPDDPLNPQITMELLESYGYHSRLFNIVSIGSYRLEKGE